MITSFHYFITSDWCLIASCLFTASYIGKGCHPDDPKLNECVVRKGSPAIKLLTNGELLHFNSEITIFIPSLYDNNDKDLIDVILFDVITAKVASSSKVVC